LNKLYVYLQKSYLIKGLETEAMITTSNLPISLPAHLPVLEVDETQNGTIPVHPSVTSSLKRLIDFLGALIGLGVTAIVAIPVALALALDNPGPIFYSQTRCGLSGRPFRIWALVL